METMILVSLDAQAWMMAKAASGGDPNDSLRCQIPLAPRAPNIGGDGKAPGIDEVGAIARKRLYKIVCIIRFVQKDLFD
jgi:hypothetical protein